MMAPAVEIAARTVSGEPHEFNPRGTPLSNADATDRLVVVATIPQRFLPPE